MKKIIRRVILCIVCIIVAAVAALAILLFGHGGEKDVRVTITDPAGNTYVAVTDKTGNQNALVSDENGNVWKVEVNPDGSLSDKKELDSEHNKDDVINNYTGPEINVTVNGNEYTGNVSEDTQVTEKPTKPSKTETTTTKKDTSTTKPAKKPSKKPSKKEPNILKYQRMFASGTYYMEFTTNDESLGNTPIVAAAKNGNVLISTVVENMNCTMIYKANSDKTYLVLKEYKMYCSVPEDLLGEDFDMNEFNLMDKFGDDISPKAIKTETVTINGKKLTRESYENADGAKMMYYFDNGQLVRLDNQDENGDRVETYISKITSDVPDSTFEVPKGYTSINLSWLNMFAEKEANKKGK